MACVITVDHTATKGYLVGGTLQEIYVQGTATGCSSLKVTLTCGTVSTPPASVTVSPTAPFTWFYTFKNLPSSCGCGGQFKIRAECDDGSQQCVNADADSPYDLPCESKGPIVPLCPPVNWKTGAFGSCKSGKRSLQVTATVQGTGSYSAELRDGSTNALLDSKSGSGPLVLSHTGDYPGGSAQAFKVVMVQPAGCPGATHSLTVPACSTPPPPGSGTWGKAPDDKVLGGGESDKHPGPFEKIPPPPTPPVTDNKCGSMVWVVGALLSLAAALTALTLAWFICVPGSVPPTWVWAITIGVGVAAGLSIAVWYIVCNLVPDCVCPTGCDWLQIGTMTTLASAAILTWLATCCPTWPLAIGFGAAYTAALAGWVAGCKPGICKVLAAQLTALVSGAVPAIAYIMWVPQIAACGSTLVSTILATVGALLAASTAAACASSSKSP